jgi:hypothetical protein
MDKINLNLLFNNKLNLKEIFETLLLILHEEQTSETSLKYYFKATFIKLELHLE